MSAKVHINLSQGILEVEGEPDFVRGIYDDFKQELTNLAAQKKLPINNDLQLMHSTPEDVINVDSLDQASSLARKKVKRFKNIPPKGHSCSDRIMVLRKKGFFTSQRTTGEIVQGLGQEGWTHKNNQVSAAAVQMFNRGDIQRTSKGKGFAYYWDRN